MSPDTENVYGLTPVQELELLHAETRRLFAASLKSLNQTIAMLDALADEWAAAGDDL